MLIQVSVQNMKLFIPVGWYPEEIKMLTEVEVSLSVSYERKDPIHDDLNQTIDYAVLHEVLHHYAQQPCRLLETFGESVLGEVYERFKHLKLQESQISIQKSQILHEKSTVQGQFVSLKQQYTSTP